VWPVVTSVVCGLCVCVSVLDITISCTETDEPVEVLFAAWTWVDPRNHVLGGGPDPPRERANISQPVMKCGDYLDWARYISQVATAIQHSLSVLLTELPSVLWRCWLVGTKGIRPVKSWVVGCWHGYLSGARCRLAYGPADATATHCLLLQ